MGLFLIYLLSQITTIHVKNFHITLHAENFGDFPSVAKIKLSGLLGHIDNYPTKKVCFDTEKRRCYGRYMVYTRHP